MLPALLIGAAAARAQSAGSPIDALHQAQGGAIAQPRPDMPGSDQPYPNLATVPPKPAPGDAAERNALAQRLVADRANAQYETKIDPLPPVKSAPPPAAGDDVFGASLAGAPRPVQKPVSVAQSAPKPKSATTTTAAAPAPAPGKATPAKPLDSLPPLAAAPPPPSGVAGPAVTAPTPQPVAPPPAASDAPAAGARPADTADKNFVMIGFAPGGDQLAGEALVSLKLFARTRGNHTIEVTGFGDVDSSDAAAQTAGLKLALGRARAIAGYLTGVGVPPAALRVTAEAQGHGGSARLTD